MKLFARDVHGLSTLDGIDDSHVLHGKAIHRVEVMGMVVHAKAGATKMFGGYGERGDVCYFSSNRHQSTCRPLLRLPTRLLDVGRG